MTVALWINQALIDLALGVLIWFAFKGVGQGGFLKLVVPTWLYHIDCLLRGQDPPGEVTPPKFPPPLKMLPRLPLPARLPTVPPEPYSLCTCGSITGHHLITCPAAPENISKPCKGFQWVGQSFASCAECGLPFWEHTHDTRLKPGAGPFDDEPFDYVLISDETKAKVKARWEDR